ncbi:hypothetical protein M0R04_05220 [Candidatus Dojkabacteria bacterium]|jgi:hypothetical protein|nr:hypothetical protein [Candidatus Dojkabacteria bacterium]
MIEKEKSQVKLITFKSGMTILGDVTVNDLYVEVKQPVQVVSQQSQSGPMLGFVPFLDYTVEFAIGIPFMTEDILTTTSPVRELLNQYNKIFGSGIEIVSSLKGIK